LGQFLPLCVERYESGRFAVLILARNNYARQMRNIAARDGRGEPVLSVDYKERAV
jgi:hypothetical protein